MTSPPTYTGVKSSPATARGAVVVDDGGDARSAMLPVFVTRYVQTTGVPGEVLVADGVGVLERRRRPRVDRVHGLLDVDCRRRPEDVGRVVVEVHGARGIRPAHACEVAEQTGRELTVRVPVDPGLAGLEHPVRRWCRRRSRDERMSSDGLFGRAEVVPSAMSVQRAGALDERTAKRPGHGRPDLDVDGCARGVGVLPVDRLHDRDARSACRSGTPSRRR